MSELQLHTQKSMDDKTDKSNKSRERKSYISQQYISDVWEKMKASIKSSKEIKERKKTKHKRGAESDKNNLLSGILKHSSLLWLQLEDI